MGLVEMWIEDPDGVRIILVEVPPITLSGVTRDRLRRQDDDRYADPDVGLPWVMCAEAAITRSARH